MSSRQAMADPENHYGFPDDAGGDDDQSIVSVCCSRRRQGLSADLGVMEG